MSSRYWNFRDILDVDPDSVTHTCVGTTVKGKRCTRKRPFLKNADLMEAADLLDTMDRTARLKSSYKYLEELADLCLCLRNHRTAEQISRIVSRWEYCIAEFAEEVKREKKRVEKIKTKQKLLEMKKIAMQLREDIEEDNNKENALPHVNKPIASAANPVNEPVAPKIGDLIVEDPFVERESGATKPNLFTSPVFGSAALGNTSFNVPAAWSFSHTFVDRPSQQQQPDPSPEDFKSLFQKFITAEKLKDEARRAIESLPSPPSTPPQTRVAIARAEKQVPMSQQFTLANLTMNTAKDSVSDLTTPTKIAYEFGSSKNAGEFSFKSFNLSHQVPAKVSISEHPQSTPSISTTETPTNLQRKSSLKQPLPKIDTTMGTQTTTVKTVQESTEDTCQEKSTKSIAKPSIEEDEYLVSPSTPINNSLVPLIDNLKYTPSPLSATKPAPAPAQEESFGYAVITPQATRYSTYLPARQQYGLATPPETPEKYPPHPSTPKTPLQPDDIFTSITTSRSYTIPRKPLPLPHQDSGSPRDSLRRRNGVRRGFSGIYSICQVCNSPHAEGGSCRCGRVIDDEEVGNGCLDSLGWARLRERVLQGMKPRSRKSDGDGEKERRRKIWG